MLRFRLPVLVSFLLALATSAGAATLRVTNNGADAIGCGILTPCRSIGRAVQNAIAGDTILVGPGQYSDDLDNDGVLNEPGEEPSTGLGSIRVDKPLRIVSQMGASSTLLRTRTLTFSVESSNVTIGQRNAGFTIATRSLPIVVAGTSQLQNVRIGGNVLALDGPDGPAGIIVINAIGGRIEHNRIFGPNGCSAGMWLNDSSELVAHNVVSGCAVGFRSDDSRGTRFVRNAALGNVLTSQLGTAVGFDLRPGTVTEFIGNAAIGNGTGVRVWGSIPAFRNNALVGNLTNCGLENRAGVPFLAAANWWGAPSGPGPDPADGACDVTAAPVTATTPFLPRDPTQPQPALR